MSRTHGIPQTLITAELGRILCEGTPEEVARHKTSITGAFLKPYLR